MNRTPKNIAILQWGVVVGGGVNFFSPPFPGGGEMCDRSGGSGGFLTVMLGSVGSLKRGRDAGAELWGFCRFGSSWSA
jgi:hypothetical protein